MIRNTDYNKYTNLQMKLYQLNEEYDQCQDRLEAEDEDLTQIERNNLMFQSIKLDEQIRRIEQEIDDLEYGNDDEDDYY